VFEDLGHPRPAETLAKSNSRVSIAALTAERGLTQGAAAGVLQVDQPRVSALVRGRLAGFSLDRLVRSSFCSGATWRSSSSLVLGRPVRLVFWLPDWPLAGHAAVTIQLRKASRTANQHISTYLLTPQWRAATRWRSPSPRILSSDKKQEENRRPVSRTEG
jgi:predicted XRE-type DNA-binding protein